MNILKRILLILTIFIAFDAQAIGFVVKDTNVCASTPILFKDTSTAPAGLTIVSRTWNFDGQNILTSTADSIFFAYNSDSLVGKLFSVNLTLKYSDGSSASYNLPQSIFVRARPQIDEFSISDTITCPNVPIFFTLKSSVDGAKGGTTLGFWNLEYGDINGVTLFSNNEFVNHGYSASGLYTAKYTVRDQLGCISQMSKLVQIYPHPTVNFEPIRPRCKDSLVIYENRTIGRDSTWKWEWTVVDSAIIKSSLDLDSGINGTTLVGLNVKDLYHTHIFPTTRPTKFQQVTLKGTNKFKCFHSITKPYKVDTTPILVITPSIDTTICFGESIKYTVRGSDTVFYDQFTWGTRILNDSIVLFTPKNTITYKVYGKTKECPPAGKDIKIKVVQPIFTNITFTPPNILRGNQSIMELNPNAVYDSIRWTPNSSLTRPTSDSTGASPQFTTTYVARIYYNLFNKVCSHVDSATLLVDGNCAIDSLKIPTAFTPNGDDLNDEFYVKSFSLKRILSFNVYNRWGDKVFNVSDVAANDKKFGWNGKVNNSGEDMPVGVYIYNISAICANNQIVNFQGEITILR
jgi:gliding motility-associated-like protein